jgi:hypothetical protein
MNPSLKSLAVGVVASVLAALGAPGCAVNGPEVGSSAAAQSGNVDCAAYAAPNETSTCGGCTSQTCQPNGCFGGYYCNSSNGKCEKDLPTACQVPPTPDAGADALAPTADAGTDTSVTSNDTGPTTNPPDTSPGADAAPVSQEPVILSSFETPTSAGLAPVITAINGAQTSIQMVMVHLTVQAVADALVAASQRGVSVQVIIDQGNWNDHTTAALKTELANGGVTVTPSSTGFRITHEKSFVVDGTTAYIMSLNLTSPYVDTRDYAVVTKDPAVVADFLTLFQADLANAQNGTDTTPTNLTSPYLAVSPVNSEARLTAFVDSATTTLVASSENIGDPSIQNAMIAAVARGVSVRILAPECDQNVDATYDLPFLAQLSAAGVTARAMPGPPSPTLPYTHAKMMIADGQRAFIGSVNFSTASTTDARELGIFFEDPTSIQMISQAFESDWAQGITPPAASSVSCPAVSSGG